MTNFYKSIVFLILANLACSNTTSAQTSTLNISYHGNNLWNPGLNVGIEQPWSLSKKLMRKDKAYSIETYFNADLGFFRDYSRQRAVFTHLGINKRVFRDDTDGFHYQFGFSPVGIYRSFLPETREYTVNGTVENVFFPGRWYYAPVVSIGMGKFHQGQVNTGWFVAMNITALIPYNSYIMPLLNIKVGYRLAMKRQIIKFNTSNTSQEAGNN